jgi:hypothetical protein
MTVPQLVSFHHSSHKSPYGPLLVAADSRRRRTAAATAGEEQDSSHQVPSEEKGAYREPGAGGLCTTGRRTECENCVFQDGGHLYVRSGIVSIHHRRCSSDGPCVPHWEGYSHHVIATNAL